MDDPLKKVEGAHKGGAGKADKHRQQLIIGGTFALVLIAYLTYKKMGKGGGAPSGAPGVNPPTTATDVPSGTPAPDTTVPFAAPTDTTGGGTIQTGSSTNAPGAPSATKAQGTPPTPAPIKAPQAQSITPPTPHPAGHPALIKPLAPSHPIGQADSKVAGPSTGYPLAPATPTHPFIKTMPYSTSPATPPKATPQKAP
jgi:hypothetical protein